VFITDWGNHRIRKVAASTGVITTMAGTGAADCSGDGGQATDAAIAYPHGINLDSAGNVYFTCGSYIRKVTVSTGIIGTVVGTGSSEYNGDNIQATAATLNGPSDVVLDIYDNLYICDLSNHRVRKVDVSTGLITTIAGTGTASSSGDGSAATSATLNAPSFSRFDSNGNYYISEAGGNFIRKVANLVDATPTQYPTLAPSSNSIITTIAGSGSYGYSGDNGDATSAGLKNPFGVDIDATG
jgi:trimeric autotransporter adhesin